MGGPWPGLFRVALHRSMSDANPFTIARLMAALIGCDCKITSAFNACTWPDSWSEGPS